jgi:hypothetical protein
LTADAAPAGSDTYNAAARRIERYISVDYLCLCRSHSHAYVRTLPPLYERVLQTAREDAMLIDAAAARRAATDQVVGTMEVRYPSPVLPNKLSSLI